MAIPTLFGKVLIQWYWITQLYSQALFIFFVIYSFMGHTQSNLHFVCIWSTAVILNSSIVRKQKLNSLWGTYSSKEVVVTFFMLPSHCNNHPTEGVPLCVWVFPWGRGITELWDLEPPCHHTTEQEAQSPLLCLLPETSLWCSMCQLEECDTTNTTHHTMKSPLPKC